MQELQPTLLPTVPRLLNRLVALMKAKIDKQSQQFDEDEEREINPKYDPSDYSE